MWHDLKVIYRSGVSDKCPEGEKWIVVPSPQISITQLSVSPSGVVWGVTWEGVAVVRVGVSFYEPTGKKEDNYLGAFVESYYLDVRLRKNKTSVFQRKMLHLCVKCEKVSRTESSQNKRKWISPWNFTMQAFISHQIFCYNNYCESTIRPWSLVVIIF